MDKVIYYFMLFMIYSFLGWCFECIHMAITTKEIVNRGFLNGPFIPIYGIGLTLIVTFLSKYKSNFILLLILSFFLIAVLEYIVSFILERIFNLRWWDYSNRKFNLNGRICLNTMTIFIIGAMLIIYFVHPIIIILLNKLSLKVLKIIFGILFIYLWVDLILSVYFVLKYKKNNNKSNRLDKTPEIKNYIKNQLLKYLS